MASLATLGAHLQSWELWILNLLILFTPFQMLLKCLSSHPGFRRKISVKNCFKKSLKNIPQQSISFRCWRPSSELCSSNETQISPCYCWPDPPLWLEVHHLHLSILGGTLQASEDLRKYPQGKSNALSSSSQVFSTLHFNIILLAFAV